MTNTIRHTSLFYILLSVISVFISCNKDKKDAETALIYSYIDENGIIADTLPDGLLISFSGFSTPETLSSDYPKKGDTIITIYKAYFLTSGNALNLFDEASLNDNYKYVFQIDPVIDGWEEGIGLMKKGSSATLIIPSKLAYGSKQIGIIPPYSPLVFNIRIYDIK
jgi:FKBP-type peptidyl-prolyl cis-trans isomerase